MKSSRTKVIALIAGLCLSVLVPLVAFRVLGSSTNSTLTPDTETDAKVLPIRVAELTKGERLEVFVDRSGCRGGSVFLMNIQRDDQTEIYITEGGENDAFRDYRVVEGRIQKRVILDSSELAAVDNYFDAVRAGNPGRNGFTTIRYELALIRNGKTVRTEVILDNLGMGTAIWFVDDERTIVDYERFRSQFPDAKYPALSPDAISYWTRRFEVLR